MATIHIQYFGEIAEKTNKASESIQIDVLTTSHILQFLKNTYQIEGNGIQLAVNQELVNTTIKLKETDEIAILSPFAGG